MIQTYTEQQAERAIAMSRRGFFGIGAALLAERVAPNVVYSFAPPPRLRVWAVGDEDWYVSDTAEGALLEHVALVGEIDPEWGPYLDDVTLMPDGHRFSIHWENEDCWTTLRTKTCAEWAREQGAGLLATRNF